MLVTGPFDLRASWIDAEIRPYHGVVSILTAPAASAADPGAASPLRPAIEQRLEELQQAIATAELRLSDSRRAREDQVGRVAELETAWRHSLKNLVRFDPEDIDRTFRSLAATRADLSATEERCRHLAARLEDHRHEEALLRRLQIGLSESTGATPEEGSAHLREASRQVFQIIEEERMRIARDMHDGPAQSMANLVLQAEILERLISRDPQLVYQELADFKEGVRAVLDETRRLIFDLRPMTLDDLGLMPTLRRFVKEFEEKAGITAHLRVVGEEQRLPGAYENTLFRIIQEALNNVRKHSHARDVEVVITFETGRVTATVKDNGVGFDTSAGASPDRSRRLGLTSMRERAQLEKGELHILSEPGGGTEVRVSFQY